MFHLSTTPRDVNDCTSATNFVDEMEGLEYIVAAGGEQLGTTPPSRVEARGRGRRRKQHARP